MKQIFSNLLTLSICLTPLIVPLIAQPAWGQSRNSQVEEAKQLLEQGEQQSRQGQPQRGLQTFQQALAIARELKDRELEANALGGIGFSYNQMSQRQQALNYYNQALAIFAEVGKRSEQAIALNNIGAVYSAIGQPQKALEYYNQALPILKDVGNRLAEAATLNNIGSIYSATSQPQKALDYFNQALPIFKEISNRSAEATTLNNLGLAYVDVGQFLKAADYYIQALRIFKEIGNRALEAMTLNNIGGIYRIIEQPQKALDYFNQALPISKEIGNRALEATALNNIGGIYSIIEQPQKALDYFNQALLIKNQIDDRLGKALALNNIAVNYEAIGQTQKALEYYKQALLILKEVGNRDKEATILTNMALIYRDTNQQTESVANLEHSVNIILEMRRGLSRQNRQQFLQANNGSASALITLLIDQNKAERAYELVNLATAADLADYTRLINAKVPNPQAQRAINDWNQLNQQLELQRQQLQSNFSEANSLKMRELEIQVHRQAEDISRRFPDVAELFETTTTDIEKLKTSIPSETIIVQPVLLTNVRNVPNTLAIFILTKGKLSVVKKAIDPTEFDRLITQYLKQVKDDSDANYTQTAGKLYDILIRPVEDKINKLSPKQVSVITTGKLRYLPFETLYDSKTDQFLIQKYPVNYLTRLSTRSLQQTVERKASILALGNPVPVKPYALNGAEEEVNRITETLPGSQSYIRNQATLDTFKTQAPRFRFLHLATHGCFQPEGCCLDQSTCQKPDKVDLPPNTILFANRQFFNIADAALLGFNNTELLTLSACQTAQETNSNGEGIAGVAYIFERAGAKAVMASLWSTEDKATEQLMIQFYENLKQGMTKGEALRQAKLKQIDRHPFYWSPFILIGDAR